MNNPNHPTFSEIVLIVNKIDPMHLMHMAPDDEYHSEVRKILNSQPRDLKDLENIIDSVFFKSFSEKLDGHVVKEMACLIYPLI